MNILSPKRQQKAAASLQIITFTLLWHLLSKEPFSLKKTVKLLHLPLKRHILAEYSVESVIYLVIFKIGENCVTK